MHDYTRVEMKQCLKAVGLEPGDTVLFHVGLGMLGRPENVSSQQDMNRHFLECCEEVLGPSGTILVPAYSYSLCRGEMFDPKHTKATIGPFPEFFRLQPGIRRSHDPILSVCGKGPAAEGLFKELPTTSYGEGCLYARLVEAKAKICTVGLRMHWATFRHHIEEMASVPFRYRKYFCGEIINEDGFPQETLWVYSVRLWSKRANPDGSALAEMMVRDGVCASAALGRSEIYCVRADAYWDYAQEQIRANPWLSAQGPGGDPLQIEGMLFPPQKVEIVVSTGASLGELANALAPQPRHCMSDAYDAALEALARQIPMTIHEYPTGTICGGRIVPEKWLCREAFLATPVGEKIISAQDNPLQVMSFSHAFSGEVRRAELSAHLHVNAGAGDAVPYVRNPFRKDWGFCISSRQLEQLSASEYAVKIDAQFMYGKMRIGESVIEGQDEGELLLCSYLAGPCQFNSGLSGVLAGLEVMRELRSLKKPRRTVRLLILPDALGFYAWAQHTCKSRTFPMSGVLLNMLATPGGDLSMSGAGGARRGQQLSMDACAVDLDQMLARSVEDSKRPMPPPLGIPLLEIQRTLPCDNPRHPFPEYETDADKVTDEGLEALRSSVVVILEALKPVLR